MARSSVLGLLALSAAASCGHLESYDYAQVLEGPFVVHDGYGACSTTPPGTTEEEEDALVDAFSRRQWELLPEWFRWHQQKLTLTGAVDGATGKAELVVEVTARAAELEVAELYIEGELVDSVSIEGGGIVRGNGDQAVATLVGWTPPPKRSFVPWGPARQRLMWFVSYGSAADPHSSACGIQVDPFVKIRVTDGTEPEQNPPPPASQR